MCFGADENALSDIQIAVYNVQLAVSRLLTRKIAVCMAISWATAVAAHRTQVKPFATATCRRFSKEIEAESVIRHTVPLPAGSFHPIAT
jgi:hypothetical protein